MIGNWLDVEGEKDRSLGWPWLSDLGDQVEDGGNHWGKGVQEKEGVWSWKWGGMEMMIPFWACWFWVVHGTFKEKCLLGCWCKFKVQRETLGWRPRCGSHQQVDCNWSQRNRWNSSGEICRLNLEGRPTTELLQMVNYYLLIVNERCFPPCCQIRLNNTYE